jgi:hypothetical protein
MNKKEKECDLYIDGRDVIHTHLDRVHCFEAKHLIKYIEAHGYGKILE